jgi:hypothetical protein
MYPDAHCPPLLPIVRNRCLVVIHVLQGLSDYLKSFSYSSTLEDDLFFYLEEAGLAAGTWPGMYPLEEATHQSFGEVMKSWTNQVMTAPKPHQGR